MDIYYHSVGRNATMLLNFPIMPNGLIHEKDEKAIQELTKTLKETFKNNLAKNSKISATTSRGKTTQFAANKATDNDLNSYWATNDECKNGLTYIRFWKSNFI